MGGVAEDQTLARIRDDMARGQVAMARQRLRGLVGSYPRRLDLREQLAELYRRDGLSSQAGRWSYLGAEADPAELRAFEREFADPVARMRALSWRGPEDAAGPEAATRLAALRTVAERQVGRPLQWEKLPTQVQDRTSWGDRVFAVGLIGVVGLFVLGGVSFVVQGVRVLFGWLGW